MNNNVKSKSITIEPGTDIQVNQTVNGQTNINANVGDTVTYVVTVKNNGPDNATGLTILDQLPTGLSLLTVNPSTGSYNQNTGVWTVGNLTNGTTTTLTITAKVTGTGTIINNPSLDTVDQFDWNFNNNSQETYITA